jgi:hypothetical protein
MQFVNPFKFIQDVFPGVGRLDGVVLTPPPNLVFWILVLFHPESSIPEWGGWSEPVRFVFNRTGVPFSRKGAVNRHRGI